MGLVESTLKPETVKPLVRADTITPLPSLTIDSCKFTNGSYGFLIQTTDLAKNVSVHTVPLKKVVSPIENVYTYVGKDNTLLSFSRDLLNNTVYCILYHRTTSVPIFCECVSVYEPIGHEDIDRLARLFN